jgi:predicted amidohydrolase
MRHIAFEGRCFVLSACQFARRRDFPTDYPLDMAPLAGSGSDAVLIDGGSVIVDPLGELLAGPHYDGERVLIAEIDRGAIARGKYDLDVVGHYARPDVFRLHVDEHQKAPVVREP